MNPFALLFWPGGASPRLGWWLGQIVVVLLFVTAVFFTIRMQALAHDVHSVNNLSQFLQKQGTLTQEERRAEAAQLTQQLKADPTLYSNFAWAGGAVILAIYVMLCVEIRRWHDLHMSGLLYLTRYIAPASHLFLPLAPSAIILVVVGLIRLYFLGFAPGYGPKEAARPAPAAPPKPAPSSSASILVPAALAVVFVIVAIGIGYKLGVVSISPAVMAYIPPSVRHYLEPTTSADLATASALPTEPLPQNNASVPQIVYGDFAKDWIIINGEKLTGITSVVPVSGDQVDIIYANGGKAVPASTLPAGFRALWNLTPSGKG